MFGDALALGISRLASPMDLWVEIHFVRISQESLSGEDNYEVHIEYLR